MQDSRGLGLKIYSHENNYAGLLLGQVAVFLFWINVAGWSVLTFTEHLNPSVPES